MSFLARLRHVAGAMGKKAVLDLTEYQLKESCLARVDGIAVCDISLARHRPEAFLRLTREAMDLIRTCDLRRHRRVCRFLDYIANQEITSVGNFDRKLKICHVDYAKFFTGSDHEKNVRLYSCLLIHEATHGLLEEKLILYDKQKRERIEGLCHAEEFRFARHFGEEWAGRYIGPFRPERWKPYWEGGRGDRLGALWARLRERH